MTPIIVALDKPTLAEALALADALDPRNCRLKVGKELFTRCGPEILKALHQRDFEVFLDLKFHDIPNTCAQAVLAAADQGVWMTNVHASGGLHMMQAAAQILQRHQLQTLLIGVTVLTSMTEAELHQLGVVRSLEDQVLDLARQAQAAGLQGVVCSAWEAAGLRQQLGDQFLRVTPGIRPASAAQDDQQRIMTPQQALAQGSSYLVIGRPITGADKPAAALDEIIRLLPPQSA